MSDIAERVKIIVAKQLGLNEAEVVEDANIIDDLGADSLDTIEFIMAFEEEFGCKISDEAAEELLTINNVIDFIEAEISK